MFQMLWLKSNLTFFDGRGANFDVPLTVGY